MNQIGVLKCSESDFVFEEYQQKSAFFAVILSESEGSAFRSIKNNKADSSSQGSSE
jgi:hypothetical protein